MRLPALLLGLLLLGGCATVTPTAETIGTRVDWETIEQWQTRGRFTLVQAPAVHQARLDWLQRGTSLRLRLDSALGQRVLEIESDVQGARLQTAEGQRLTAPDAATLLKRATDSTLPVAGLSYWLRALPDPARPAHVERSALGRTQHIDQDGWHIHYPAWQRDAAGRDLPQRIVAEHRDGTSLTLLLAQWQLD